MGRQINPPCLEIGIGTARRRVSGSQFAGGARCANISPWGSVAVAVLAWTLSPLSTQARIGGLA